MAGTDDLAAALAEGRTPRLFRLGTCERIATDGTAHSAIVDGRSMRFVGPRNFAPGDVVVYVSEGADPWVLGPLSDLGELRLPHTDGQAASTTSTDHPFQIGPSTGGHLVADANQIMARGDQSSNELMAGLHLNYDTDFGATAPVTVNRRGLPLLYNRSLTPSGATPPNAWDMSVQWLEQMGRINSVAYYGGGQQYHSFNLPTAYTGGILWFSVQLVDAGSELSVHPYGTGGASAVRFRVRTETGLYTSAVDIHYRCVGWNT